MVDNAHERHSHITHVFDELNQPNFSSQVCRETLMKAYGLRLESEVEATTRAQKEYDFANDCLSGKGPSAMGVGKGDLRTILTIEIGMGSVSKDGQTPPKPLGPPWLAGDWPTMARLIRKIAGRQLGLEENFNGVANEFVRVWPTDFTGKIDDPPDGMDIPKEWILTTLIVDSVPIKIFASSRKYRTRKWIQLPYGPAKCRQNNPGGIYPKMWRSLDSSPKPFGDRV